MTTKARSGAGTKLYLGNGASSETFAAVAEVLSIELGGMKIDQIDVTNLDSPLQDGLRFREYIGGLADGGDVTFTANYLPGDTAQDSLADARDGKNHNWVIMLPDGETPGTALGYWSFAGMITQYQKSFSIDKQMTIQVTVKMSGADSFTSGNPAWRS